MHVTFASRASAFALALVVTAVTGCSGGDGASPSAVTGVGGASVESGELQAAVEGVCKAAEAASGDTGQARDVFLDRAHDRLHDLASALEQVDRAAAARLLTAKQRVEQAIEADLPGGELASRFAALRDAAVAGLDKLHIEPPRCARP